MFSFLLGCAGIVAAGIAAVAGFGIGSVLTPILATESGTKLAVAAIAIPHFVGTAQRYWKLRRHVDRHVLLGLAGALAHVWISSRILSAVFGALLVLAAIFEFTGWVERIHWGRTGAWVAGTLSGALGGLVGNQGGIRSAAMLGFDVPKESFVATATAIALFVDAARLPVYLVTQWNDLLDAWPKILAATIGVVIGTALGTRLLGRIPTTIFRKVVAVVLLALGVFMLFVGGKE